MLKETGNSEINKELKTIFKEIENLILSNQNSNKDSLILIKEKIRNFRMKLAYNRRTEDFESRFEWTKYFDESIKKIDELIEKQTHELGIVFGTYEFIKRNVKCNHRK